MKQVLVAAVGTAILLANASHATEISDYTVVTNSTPFGFAPSRTLSAVCPDGTVALGGGAETVAGGGALPVLESSQPILGTVEGWTAHANDEAPEEAGGWRLYVTAICGNIDGYTRDTNEIGFFGLRKVMDNSCLDGAMAIGGGMTGFDTDGAVLQRSISVDFDTWGGTMRASDPDFTARVTTICAPADDDITVLSLSSTTNTAATKSISRVCPEGTSVLGGGAEAVDDEDLRAALTTNGPVFADGKIIGWRAEADSRQASPPPWRLDIAVTCPEPAHASIVLLALAVLRVRGAASSRARARRACRRP